MRILLIEDEKNVVNFLKPNLEACYFAVDVAEDGERGSFMARTNSYDLIILDNVLPKKDGKQTCEEIRAANKIMPIIVLSVIVAANKKIELLNSGADDYITKPFSFKELLAIINALLRRPNKIEGSIMQIDDLVLDTKKNKVTRMGKEILLTKKEFMLLEYMMRNQGIALSRGEILEHVWDMNTDPFSNTIESHILNLRKKITIPKSKKKLIHTLSGKGYKIDI